MAKHPLDRHSACAETVRSFVYNLSTLNFTWRYVWMRVRMSVVQFFVNDFSQIVDYDKL